MKHRIHKEVKLLLIHHLNKKVKMKYDSNSNTLKMPLIGPRPPFYCHPHYEHYYPIL